VLNLVSFEENKLIDFIMNLQKQGGSGFLGTMDLDLSQCFGSVFIDSRSGSGSRVLMTKNLTKFTAENFFYIFFAFFGSKIAIYLSLGLQTGRPSYRRSLLPSKNIQH
jgi:hypothetical protein